uniref:Patellin-6 n=1 Tax=Kalanchoe fedtschenkoi TaxID=63787 RepID=A0A7N0T6L8_KALFE
MATTPATATAAAPSPIVAKNTFITTLLDAAVTPFRTPSFHQDTYRVSTLKPSDQRSLTDLKSKLAALFDGSRDDDADGDPSFFTIWGVPLLSSDERSDVVLLKFLRARDFKVADALQMLQSCLTWRKEFGAESLLTENLGFKEIEGVVAKMSGVDREGHPVCYNAYGVFKDKEMYEKVFGDDEKLKQFLRWRVQVLERGIQMLDLRPGGVNSIIQVTDLKDMPKRELRVVSNQILSLFQDNYPEMVARKIFVNVPWYFSVLYSVFSPFLTQRTKSKFVIAKEGHTADILYKYIKPEDIPVQYGGLSRPSDPHTAPAKPASEFILKGGEKLIIEIEGIEACASVTWEIAVGGWDLEYNTEFTPYAKGSYAVAVEKPRQVSSDEEAIHNSYTTNESGKLVLTLDNSASKRKKVGAYRYSISKGSALAYK